MNNNFSYHPEYCRNVKFIHKQVYNSTLTEYNISNYKRMFNSWQSMSRWTHQYFYFNNMFLRVCMPKGTEAVSICLCLSAGQTAQPERRRCPVHRGLVMSHVHTTPYITGHTQKHTHTLHTGSDTHHENCVVMSSPSPPLLGSDIIPVWGSPDFTRGAFISFTHHRPPLYWCHHQEGTV